MQCMAPASNSLEAAMEAGKEHIVDAMMITNDVVRMSTTPICNIVPLF